MPFEVLKYSILKRRAVAGQGKRMWGTSLAEECARGKGGLSYSILKIIVEIMRGGVRISRYGLVQATAL
jgi:hypothetical protein